MMQQIANFIVDHDPMMVLRRTHDTVRYIRWAWNKDHAAPIDEEELCLFLCDEHYGDLTDEQMLEQDYLFEHLYPYGRLAAVHQFP